jgi:outer membrane protein TolC
MRARARFVVAAGGLFLLLAFGPGPGHAQTPEPQTLTLQEALDRAERHNPAFRQTTGELELNLLDSRDQWLSILPQPQFSLLSTSMNWRRVTVVEDLFGNPLESEEEETIRTSSSSQAVGLSLSLNLGEFLELRRVNEQAFVREMNVETGLYQLRADVTSAFLELQEREAVLELEEDLLEMARVNRDVAQRLYALARRDRIDLVSLELDLAEQEHELDQARARVETARLALRNLIGDPDLGPFRIVPMELAPLDPQELDPEALVRLARESSPVVRQAEAALRQEERGVNLVRAEWLPTVSMNWRRTRQDFVRGGEAFLDPNPAGDWDQTVGLMISFPDLGQYFLRRNRQQRSEVAVRGQREQLREARNDVEQEVRTLVNDLRATARSLEIQDRRAELSAERLTLAREAYRLGQQSYLELQSAQEQAAQAGRQALAARYAFEAARIALERALGMEVDRLIEVGGGG